MESEKDFAAVITAGGGENASDLWQQDVGELLAIKPKQLQFGSRVVFVLRQQFAAGYARVLEHGVGLRDDFLPVFALGIGGVSYKDAITGRIFVAGDVEFALEYFRSLKKLSSGSDFCRRVFRLKIQQIHLRFRPALSNINKEPAVIL